MGSGRGTPDQSPQGDWCTRCGLGEIKGVHIESAERRRQHIRGRCECKRRHITADDCSSDSSEYTLVKAFPAFEMSSVSASTSAISASASLVPSSTANNGTDRVDCRFDSSIDNCFAQDSPDTSDPSAQTCCLNVGGDWNTTCEVCMFYHHETSEQQVKDWQACYKGGHSCNWADHKKNDAEKAKNAAAAAGPKMQLLAALFAAALATLS